MIGAVTIALGSKAGERARAVNKSADLLMRTTRPADQYPGSSGFSVRLAWFLEAQLGRSLLAVEEGAPVELPLAHRRMLERLALGYGAEVLWGAQWLAGSPIVLPTRTLKEADGGVLGGAGLGAEQNTALITPSAVGRSQQQPGWPVKALTGPAARYGAIGAWPDGLRPAPALLVGDRPGPGWKRPGRPNWPFISSLRTGCSAWLAELLDEHDIMEDELTWMNAYTVTGEPRGSYDIERAGFSTIIALGRNAATWCSMNGLKHQEVHHPQYWKQFQHNRPYILPRLIKKELKRETHAR